MTNNIFRRKWILSITGISIIICCGGLFTTGSVAVLINKFAGVTSCADFEYDFLKVTLPLSATTLDEVCLESFNPSYKVTFVMSPDDLTTFQQHEPVSKIDEWRTDPANSFFSESIWQQTEAELQKQGAPLESVLYGEYGDGIIAIYVLIDTSNAQQYFVQYSASYVD